MSQRTNAMQHPDSPAAKAAAAAHAQQMPKAAGEEMNVP
jgi:hypothetical protein